MLGPTVNAVTVVVYALVGCFLVRGIPSRFEEIVKKAIGLSVVFMGIKGALDSQRILLLIMSMVSGAVLGEFINIDAFMNRLGFWAERRLGIGAGGNAAKGEGRSFAKGFVSATILYCSGSLTIVGSMQSGLTGNHELLFTKSILDGATSIVFGATMGIGVVFSALAVFITESSIALTSMALRDLLTPEIIREMSAVGSLLVAAIGFNFLEIKEIRVANLIPAMFIPIVYIAIEGFLMG